MKTTLIKGAILAFLAGTIALNATMFNPLADGVIPIAPQFLTEFDAAQAQITEANGEIAKIRLRVKPASETLNTVCGATLLLNGIKQEDFDKWELDIEKKVLRPRAPVAK